jgi:hypothetical protein
VLPAAVAGQSVFTGKAQLRALAEALVAQPSRTELLDEFEPVPAEGDGILPPARKASYPISLRLESDVLHRLRVLAARKHTGYQTLLKSFVIERLYEEEKREGLV